MALVRPYRMQADRRGVAAIEFALVCFPFILLLLGVMLVGFTFFLQQALDSATQTAARQVQLGFLPSSYTETDFLQKVFCPQFGLLQSCVNITVGLHPVGDFQHLAAAGAVDAPNNTATKDLSFCSGQPGQMMYLHVVYFPPVVAVFGFKPMTGGLVSNAAFINENPTGKSVQPTNGC